MSHKPVFRKWTSPASIGSSPQNDFDPGPGDAFRLTSSIDVNISGIVSGDDGQRITLVNIGSNTITLENQGAGSAAANRIIADTGANQDLTVNESVELRYDDTTARWRILASSSDVGGAPPILGYITGNFYGYPEFNFRATNLVGSVTAAPILVTPGNTFDRLACVIQSAPAPSGTLRVRLGLYDDSSGAPGTLIAESGELNPSTAPAVSGGAGKFVEFTINETLAEGIYWAAFQMNESHGHGAPVHLDPRVGSGIQLSVTNIPDLGVADLNAFGAFPTPFVVDLKTDAAVAVWLRST